MSPRSLLLVLTLTTLAAGEACAQVDGAGTKKELWRRRESNPRGHLPEKSTDNDASHTEVIQNRNTPKRCAESYVNTRSKKATLPEHFPNTSDTFSCVSSVSDKSSALEYLPADLPPAVLIGLRNWHRLPESNQKAIVILLKVLKPKPTRES
jgi:hypothetical protein